jgi:hypothetical protein
MDRRSTRGNNQLIDGNSRLSTRPISIFLRAMQPILEHPSSKHLKIKKNAK